MYPVLSFIPLPMERVWGGRELARLYDKPLPTDVPIGETWEIVDRPEAQSVVTGGEWDGHSLHDLWQNHREGLFGNCYGGHPSERFPILVKLLDARETLSVQVHPPAHRAAELRGEPKTEMWFFLEAGAEACIYAGVKEGITADVFEKMLGEGSVEDALPRLPVRAGESIFIPSGRLHAIGADTVIAEIQQNSDTTYRVFDWNRVGLDGQPRALHLTASLASIDFQDHHPQLTPAGEKLLADCPYFRVERLQPGGSLPDFLRERFCLWGIISGTARLGGMSYAPGSFILLPAGFALPLEEPDGPLEVLEITLPTHFC